MERVHEVIKFGLSDRSGVMVLQRDTYPNVPAVNEAQMYHVAASGLFNFLQVVHNGQVVLDLAEATMAKFIADYEAKRDLKVTLQLDPIGLHVAIQSAVQAGIDRYAAAVKARPSSGKSVRS